MRRLLLAALTSAVMAAALAACGSSAPSNRQAASSAPRATADAGGSGRRAPARLVDLKSIEQLRALFDAQSDRPRLIVLASPT